MKEFEFTLTAMNGSLDATICASDNTYAYSAFHELEQEMLFLEDNLSVYKYGGDVNIINSMDIGSSERISEHTMQCLKLGAEAYLMSGGIVDVTMGAYFIKNKGADVKECGKITLDIDTSSYLVRKKSYGALDFGAIGKGYALDVLSAMLSKDWNIKNAFFSFASSSICAMGHRADGSAWKVSLGGADIVELHDESLGASGTAVLGEHIMDCRNPDIKPKTNFRTWAICKNAAIADAMSTAFMVMSVDEARQVCAKYGLKGYIQPQKDAKIEPLVEGWI